MLNSDLPIKSVADDMLNRASFAENLAQTMLDYTVSDGFAIGLYGKWGSGKTSVINMVLEKIEIQASSSIDKPVVLRFNPWLCSDPKQLISQFFKQLSSAMKLKRPKLVHICNFMNDYADAFDLANAIPIAGSILTTIGKILGKKARAYSETKSGDLQQIKDEIIATLLKEKVKIIVTIDDVDRLSNQEIISVFQLIKSLADFPYTIYLLAFDRDVVVRALSEVQKGDGAEYLEKVIQVPFELPSPNADDIYQVFFTKLNSIIANFPDEKWDKNYFGILFHLGIKHFLSSVRDVVRFANTYALKYALLKSDTYPIDLIGLTCLQIFEPAIYSKLQLHKEQLCGGLPTISNQYEQEKAKIQSAFNAITESASRDKKESVESILLCLFPKLGILKNNVYYPSRQYNHYAALNNGSICCSECFDRYFALMLEPNALPQNFIAHLLFDAPENELLDGILKINADNKTTRLLDHVNALFQKKKEDTNYSERAKLVFVCLAQQWHLLNDDTEQSFFSMPFSWRFHFTARTLLTKVPETERFNVVSKTFDNEKVSLSTLQILLYDFESQHNRFTDSDSKTEEKLLTLDEVLSLEIIFIRRTISEFEAEVILDNFDAMGIILMFEKIDIEKAEQYTSKMLRSDLLLAKFISASVGHGKVMGNSVFSIWYVHRDCIEKYTDIDAAHQKILNFVDTNEFKALPNKEQQNIVAFLIWMDKQENTVDFDGNITLPTIEKKLKELLR